MFPKKYVLSQLVVGLVILTTIATPTLCHSFTTEILEKVNNATDKLLNEVKEEWSKLGDEFWFFKNVSAIDETTGKF